MYSDAKIYFGANYGLHYETFEAKAQKAYSNTNALGLKVGYGNRDDYAFEFSLDATKNEANVISENDSQKYALNIELLKAFDFDLFFNPFVKIGFGAGYLSVDRETASTINFGSFNFGTGIFIPLSESTDIELGYIYKSISYEKFNLLDEKAELQSSQHGAYAGFNFRF